MVVGRTSIKTFFTCTTGVTEGVLVLYTQLFDKETPLLTGEESPWETARPTQAGEPGVPTGDEDVWSLEAKIGLAIGMLATLVTLLAWLFPNPLRRRLRRARRGVWRFPRRGGGCFRAGARDSTYPTTGSGMLELLRSAA